MSLLSKKDITKELGRNFFIHPFHESKIRGASINLSASEFAWSLKSKKRIFDDGVITIPGNDSALILTEEAIYVSPKLAGSFHSKVGMVAKGLGHIGTTLDPNWKGQLLITIHNHSDDEIKIDKGSTFITLILHYVRTPELFDNNNSAGRIELLRDYELSKKDNQSIQSDECSTVSGIKASMLKSESYKDFNTFRKRKIEFVKPFAGTGAFLIIVSLVYWVVSLEFKVSKDVTTIFVSTISALLASTVSFFFFKHRTEK